MPRIKGKIYLEKGKLKQYMTEFIIELQKQGLSEDEIDRRVASHYTNRVIRKYSHAEQDIMWDNLYNLITKVPGGYWQVVNTMDYMPEFEYYRFKSQHSVMKNKKTYKQNGGIVN